MKPTARFSVLVAITVACGSGTEPVQLPVTLEPVTPTSVAVTVGSEVLPSPAVRVRDSEGRPRAGVTVYFDLRYLTVAQQTSSLTGPDGVASVPWVLGQRVGTGVATAHVAGAANVVFRATGLAGPVTGLLQNSGSDQYALAGAKAEPVSISAIDAYHNPVAGATIQFTIAKGGGRLTRDTAVTDATGYARSGEWILGSAGSNLVVATSGGTSSSPFAATAVTPGAGAIDAVYTLAFVGGRPASASGWQGSVTLTSGGKFTSTLQSTCCGNTVAFGGTGQYAIAGPRMLFGVEAGNWKPDLSIGDVSTSPFLLVSLSDDDFISTWVYQRKP